MAVNSMKELHVYRKAFSPRIVLLCWCSWCLLGSTERLWSQEPEDKKLQKLSDDSRTRAEAIEGIETFKQPSIPIHS